MTRIRTVDGATGLTEQRLYALYAAFRAHLTGAEPCRDAPELFADYDGEPPKARLRRYRHARTRCRACPIRQVCLDYAIEAHERGGIWGGLNQWQRNHAATRRTAQEAAQGAVEPRTGPEGTPGAPEGHRSSQAPSDDAERVEGAA